MKSLLQILVALTIISAPAAASAAQSQVVMAGEVKLQKTVIENGKSRIVLVEPAVVVPDDRLLFVTRYSNGGSAPVQNFVVTNPLPSAVSLIYNEAEGYVVSVDGGKTWGRLGALIVPDGKGGTRSASASDVTHLRWTIQTIAPGSSGMVQYHAAVR